MNFCRTAYLIALLLIQGVVFAQDRATYYTVRDGLTMNTITCILKDSKGLLWIGTQDGLNLFDGYVFRTFKHNAKDSTSLSDQYITVLHEDKYGKLWVGTRNGLNLFDRVYMNFNRIYQDPQARKQVQHQTFFIEDATKYGSVIYAESNSVISYIPEEKRFVKLKGHIPDVTNISFFKNQMWQVWDRNHVYRFGTENHQNDKLFMNRDISSYGNDFQSVDAAGNIWYIQKQPTNSRISIYNLDKQRWVRSGDLVPAEINQLSFDRFGTAWMATSSGIYHMSVFGKPVKWYPGGQVVDSKVLSILPDSDGIFWIGFADKGLMKFDSTTAGFKVIRPNAENPTIYTSLSLDLGDFLIGGSSGLFLGNIDDTRLVQISRQRITSLTRDGLGHIWCGLPGSGILITDRKGITLNFLNASQKKICGDDITHLSYDSISRRIFIGTKSGMTVFDEQTSRFINFLKKPATASERPLIGNYVMHSYTDRSGNTWVSTNAGIEVFDRELKSIKRYNTEHDSSGVIPRTIVTSVYQDMHDRFWVSTLSGGVYAISKDSIIHFDVESGLGSNLCYGIASDDEGRIWTATSAGIDIIDPATKVIRRFNPGNALSATDFVSGSVRKSKNGDISIGSTDGLVIINPHGIQPPNSTLNVRLNEAMVNYSSYPLLDSFLLNSDDRVISFRFSAAEFTDPERIVYQYRLRGFDRNWVTVNARERKAVFTNLPYTHLKLELRAARHPAYLDAAPITIIPIYRKPPIWRTPFFLFPGIITIGFFIFIISRKITRNKMQERIRAAEMDQMIYKERERISRDLHDRLGAYAAAIKSNIVHLEKSHPNSSALFNPLKENAEEMVMALRETIWALQYQQIGIVALADRFKSLINRIAPHYPDVSIRLREYISKETDLLPGDGIHLIRIMQEALTNALRHSGADLIEITIQSNEYVQVKVEDNGKGFDQMNPKSGYGIQNMRQRALEAGFHLSIDVQCKGTRVAITYNQDLKKVK